jgi:hypothetical protein
MASMSMPSARCASHDVMPYGARVVWLLPDVDHWYAVPMVNIGLRPSVFVKFFVNCVSKWNVIRAFFLGIFLFKCAWLRVFQTDPNYSLNKGPGLQKYVKISE